MAKNNDDKSKFKVRNISSNELEAMTDEEGEASEEQLEHPEVTMTEMDSCPTCAQTANGGAIQLRMPLPIGEGDPMVITLPVLICVRCGTAYMPRSFIERILDKAPKPGTDGDVKVVSPNIIIP